MSAGSEVGDRVTLTDECVRVRAPAKLNLFLAVRSRRTDGFHELTTVFQSLSIYDELRAGLVGPPGKGHHPAARRRMRLDLWLDAIEGLPHDGDNLVLRAARAIGQHMGITDVGAEGGRDDPRTILDLQKNIPVGAGMAGGSADAAAALLALNRLWCCELSRDDLLGIAAAIGSDIPFCVVGGTALASGRGTAMAQVLCRGTFHWVICTDAAPLSTPDVYRSWDRHCRPSEVEPDAVLQALRSRDAEALGAALHNELEPAAFALRPGLVEKKQALRDAGALGVVLSGSGPTLLALVPDARAAQEFAAKTQPLFHRTFAATSPTGGPDVRGC